MASDNTITYLILRANQPKFDSAHSFFVSFAREIRDMIYDLIFQEKESPVQYMNPDCAASYYSKTRTTLPEVRLVCSRFKTEYDERDKHHLPKNHFRICQVSAPGTPFYFHRDQPDVPTLAVRTTVLYLDLKCCQDWQNPKACLVPGADRWTRGIGGPNWIAWGRCFDYPITDLPLLEKAYIYVSCGAKKHHCAVDLLPTGDPSPPSAPTLAQISLYHDVYIQAPTSGEFLSPSDGFLVRRQEKATWTHVNGWNNDKRLLRVRRIEASSLQKRGIVFF